MKVMNTGAIVRPGVLQQQRLGFVAVTNEDWVLQAVAFGKASEAQGLAVADGSAEGEFSLK